MSTPKGHIPWNAGTSKGWLDKRGYRWLYVIDRGRRRARREHRVLMEQALKRRLEPWEVVHHKNGNRHDNRIANLEIQEWGAHSIQHHQNTHHSWEAKRSMEVFAMLREEIKHLRRVNADLLAALKEMMRQFEPADSGADDGVSDCDAVVLARSVIARAEGRTP